jgi:hypothetical protein
MHTPPASAGNVSPDKEIAFLFLENGGIAIRNGK